MASGNKKKGSETKKISHHSRGEDGSVIDVKNLIKVYKIDKLEVQALRGLTMSVRKSEIVCVMGPSGSGKTTLLNIIGGLDTPTAGYAKIGDVSIGELSDEDLVKYRRTMVGHIFQNLNLIPTLTTEENVELPMIAAGVLKDKRTDRTRALLDAVGLSERATHKPGELSGGEQQRVAIAAALANDPPVMLADEPTGELDSATAKKVINLLVNLTKKFNKTTIVVTHDANIARPCDRILRIEDGVIKASYTPVEFARGETTTSSYTDRLVERTEEVDKQIRELDRKFKRGEITGEEFVEQRSTLKQTRKLLEDELHRLGE